MGHEGMAHARVFPRLAPDHRSRLGFTERQRRPPPDPVNAMLSFGYTLLAHEAVAALSTAGLDPAVGFLHLSRWDGRIWRWT
jgi:CRISPR-associated protein Cas1